jgi:hypothetical protein
MKGRSMNEDDYKKAFGVNSKDQSILEKALEHALDIRKFEIELYWKRATYFWTLIASAFAAHFIILNANVKYMTDKNFIAYIVACVGFLFTFAWLQVNRGSKQWQENWENHVDMLEDEIVGPLYKTVLSRPDGTGTILEKWVTGPAKISVSKTNQIVNVYTMVIWVLLGCNVLNPFSFAAPLSIEHVFVSLTTFGACVLIVWKGKTDDCGYEHVAIQRASKIRSEKQEG